MGTESRKIYIYLTDKSGVNKKQSEGINVRTLNGLKLSFLPLFCILSIRCIGWEEERERERIGWKGEGDSNSVRGEGIKSVFNKLLDAFPFLLYTSVSLFYFIIFFPSYKQQMPSRVPGIQWMPRFSQNKLLLGQGEGGWQRCLRTDLDRKWKGENVTLYSHTRTHKLPLTST